MVRSSAHTQIYQSGVDCLTDQLWSTNHIVYLTQSLSIFVTIFFFVGLVHAFECILAGLPSLTKIRYQTELFMWLRCFMSEGPAWLHLLAATSETLYTQRCWQEAISWCTIRGCSRHVHRCNMPYLHWNYCNFSVCTLHFYKKMHMENQNGNC